MTTATISPIRLVSVGKRYSGTKALDDVSVEVAGGTVHALVGANGAGKSTLGKIVGGVIRPDDGQLFIDDRPVRYTSPRDARAARRSRPASSRGGAQLCVRTARCGSACTSTSSAWA